MADRLEQRESVAATLVDHVLAKGLAETSLRQLAKAASVSDRMLIYYFGSKTELLSCVLMKAADRMKTDLEASVPAGTQLPAAMIFAGITAALKQPELKPYMSLWIEIVAASQREPDPFLLIAEEIGELFLSWITERIVPVEGTDSRALAGAVLAIVDGIALIETCLPDRDIETIGQTLGQWLAKT